MTPKYVTVHCSATTNTPYITMEDVKKMHTDKKWSDIGYHFVIETNGILRTGRPITQQGAHVYGHNKDNIGICLIGGIDGDGKSVDNFTNAQKQTLKSLVKLLTHVYNIPLEDVKGHRDWFGDYNGDGVIDRRDWLKDCPCFDVGEFLSKS